MGLPVCGGRHEFDRHVLHGPAAATLDHKIAQDPSKHTGPGDRLVGARFTVQCRLSVCSHCGLGDRAVRVVADLSLDVSAADLHQDLSGIA